MIMKKWFILLPFILISSVLYSQDIIVKKNNETIKAKIIEVNQNDIKYQKWDNLNGPIYTIQKTDIVSIVYQNGDAESFLSQEESRFVSTTDPKDLDIYDVIKDRNKLFKGECIHISGYEYSPTSYYNSWIGRSTSTTQYLGYVFGENLTQADRKDVYYKIKNGQVTYLSHSQFKEFLKNHDLELYNKYKVGQGLFISGWTISSIGWGADICALLWTLINYNGLYSIILPVGIVGAVCTLVGTPMLISGSIIRNKTVPNLYNAKYVQRDKTVMSWSFGAVQHGIGVNLKF